MKVIDEKIMAIPAGTCAAAKAQQFKAAQECYDAIAGIGCGAAKVANATGADAAKPAGCSLIKATDGTATAFWNTAASKTACATAGKKVAAAVSEATKVSLAVELETGRRRRYATVQDGPLTQGRVLPRQQAGGAQEVPRRRRRRRAEGAGGLRGLLRGRRRVHRLLGGQPRRPGEARAAVGRAAVLRPGREVGRRHRRRHLEQGRR